MLRRIAAEFARTRMQVHAIVLEADADDLTPPASQASGIFVDLIAAVATRQTPKLDRASRRLWARIADSTCGPDRKVVANDVDDHFGNHMAAFGDAGYLVGVAVGLELAAMAYSGSAGRQSKTRRRAAVTES
jgi:hypothetical protein